MRGRELAIRIHDIHKEFILPQTKSTSMKQLAVNMVKKNDKVTQKVLDGVSFDIHKGDFFGIVGRNGSGKSTLLKLIAGVYHPTRGSIDVHGGLTPFIELGVGFNPELSGRDNVYLNGALLGFTRKQMDEMYDEIVKFAELEPFMEQKLKNYSSGMQVRLAFSIAIKAKNDVLIFDEVLAVGDEAFQRKCLDVFEEYKRNGQTVILVTHDMDTVRKFCNRAALIDSGKLVKVGSPREVAQRYSELNDRVADAASQKSAASINQVFDARICDGAGDARQRFEVGEEMTVHLSWEGTMTLESVGINIFKYSGEHVTGRNTRYAGGKININKDHSLALTYKLDVAPGKYFVYPEAYIKEGRAIPTEFKGPAFMVTSKKHIEWSGLIDLPHRWPS